MEVMDAILSRRTRKKFVDKPVPFEIIAEILNAGNHAPSAGNLQNWQFLVVTDHSKLAKLPLLCHNQECANAPFAIIVCSDPSLCKEHFGEKERTYTVQNCAAAAQNMLISAQNYGIGAVWLGAFDEERIKNEYNIPASNHVELVLAMGFSNEIPAAKNTKELRRVTFFNEWNNRVKTISATERDLSNINDFFVMNSKTAIEKGRHYMQKYFQKKEK